MIKPLDAKEWLEQQRLAGCDFADELLILWDSQEEAEENESWLEEIEGFVHPMERRDLADWIGDKLGLLDTLAYTLKTQGYEGDADDAIKDVLYDLKIARDAIEILEAEIAELKKPEITYDL